jgi:hypothetical protein
MAELDEVKQFHGSRHSEAVGRRAALAIGRGLADGAASPITQGARLAST